MPFCSGHSKQPQADPSVKTWNQPGPVNTQGSGRLRDGAPRTQTDRLCTPGSILQLAAEAALAVEEAIPELSARSSGGRATWQVKAMARHKALPLAESPEQQPHAAGLLVSTRTTLHLNGPRETLTCLDLIRQEHKLSTGPPGAISWARESGMQLRFRFA